MSDTPTPRTNAALIKNLNAIKDAETQSFINGVPKDVVEEMVKLERDLAEANAEISRLREDCKNLASERDGLETLKADLEKKDAMLIALCHDYEMQGQAYSKALVDLAAANEKLAKVREAVMEQLERELAEANRKMVKVRRSLARIASNFGHKGEILKVAREALAIIDKKEDA